MPLTFKEYQQRVWDLFNPAIRDSADAEIYLVSKLVSEAGECLDAINNYGVSHEKFMDELSDVVWYLTALSKLHNLDLPIEASWGWNRGTRNDFATKTNLEELIVHSSVLLGTLCKNKYHNKPIHPLFIISRIEICWSVFMEMAADSGLTLSKIIEYNTAKLAVRHGTVYNAAFYTGVSSGSENK